MSADTPPPDGDVQPNGDAPEAAASADDDGGQAESGTPETTPEATPEATGDGGGGKAEAVAAGAVAAAVASGPPTNGKLPAGNGLRPAGGMRGMIDGLESPHPIGHTLPGVLQDDEFAQRFVAGLDGVLAPVFSTLDNIDAYLDSQLTPADFLPWLAGWHGAEIDAGWPEARSRDLMSRMPALQAGRGTVATLREILLLHTGAEPEIIDSGGATWSAVPGGDLPGSDGHELTVRVKGNGIDRARIEALVKEATPAHIVVHVEVID